MFIFSIDTDHMLHSTITWPFQYHLMSILMEKGVHPNCRLSLSMYHFAETWIHLHSILYSDITYVHTCIIALQIEYYMLYMWYIIYTCNVYICNYIYCMVTIMLNVFNTLVLTVKWRIIMVLFNRHVV